MPYPPQGQGATGGGSGDMTKSVYDPDLDNVVDESEVGLAAKTAGTLPVNAQGKIIFHTGDDHIYISTQEVK